MPQLGPTVHPTGRTVLAVAAVVGAGVTWIALSIAESLAWPLPTLTLYP